MNKYHHFVPDFLGIAHALLDQDAIAIVLTHDHERDAINGSSAERV